MKIPAYKTAVYKTFAYKNSAYIAPIVSAFLLSFVCSTASAENTDKLWEDYDSYVESNNDAYTIERYHLAKHIADLEDTERAARLLFVTYNHLTPKERKEVEHEYFDYALIAQKKYSDNARLQTNICWSSLIQNRIPFAKVACQRAYELDFMQPPSIINMAHIAYVNGDEAQAKDLVSQALVASIRDTEWHKEAKKDFSVLINIYSVEAKNDFTLFIDNELNSPWYLAYQKTEVKYKDALSSGDDEAALGHQKKKQRLISKRFGKDSLLNAYELALLANIEQRLNPTNEHAFEIFQRVYDILLKNGLTERNSDLVQQLSNDL